MFSLIYVTKAWISTDNRMMFRCMNRLSLIRECFCFVLGFFFTKNM